MQNMDSHIEIDTIAGSSTHHAHKGHIEVLSWSFGVSSVSTASFGGEGSGGGKANLSDFSFNKRLDKASPVLFQKCAKGEHIPKATLTVRRPSGTQEIYFTMEFEDVYLTNVSLGGSGGDGARPHESVSFTFSKVTEKYFSQKKDGTNGGEVAGNYSVREVQSVAA